MSAGFPTLDSYLARLPHGVASYPQLTAKGSVLRAILVDPPCALGPGLGLEPRVEELVRAPPPATDWLTEVELWSLSLSIYDMAFAGPAGPAAYDAWTYARNRALLGGPLYRILFAVASPDRLFSGIAKRYAAFHRGTVISKLETSRGFGGFALMTPPHVLPALAHVALCSAFRAGLDLCGGKDSKVEVTVESPEVAQFSATWR